MNRLALLALASTCFALPQAAFAEGALAPKASSSSPNETPPPPTLVETEESHMRSPPTAIAGGVLLGVGLIGVGVGTGLLVEGINQGGFGGIGDTGVAALVLGGIGHLTLPGAIMLGVGASRVHGHRLARETPLTPTVSVGLTTNGLGLVASF